MLKSLNGATFRRMINAANYYLNAKSKYIDSLNVFPVRDGDTGNNMYSTLRSANNEVNNCATNNLDALGEALSKGALRGARGNSGVILSQILRGMATEIMRQNEISTKVFAKALKSGSEYAYKAVSVPKEGTILTVIRVLGDSAETIAKKNQDFDTFFDALLKTGEEILEQTQEMLPVLKQAGVVDAGGKGLITVLEGMFKGMVNEDVDYTKLAAEDIKDIQADNDAIINYADLADIEFAYCTEYMVINLNKKTTESDIDKLREKLMEIGDSVACFGDLEFIKVHVHTNEPNRALEYALELGELYNLKIENMLEQNRELKAQQAKQQQTTKPFGVVTVANGDGILAVFKDLGADEIILGGQTMNPSAAEIAAAADKVPSDHVFVFPNNKNIILAAEQAQTLTKRFIHVIPTVTIPEGIAAMLALNLDNSLEENTEAMLAARQNVLSGAVTIAVRTTKMDGIEIKEGDFMGICDGAIKATDKNANKTVVKLLGKIMSEDKVNITLFYGEDTKEDDANALCDELSKKYPDCEVSIIPGGQPVYNYLISLE